MRIRSPSSAPPLRRRVGSIATTAIWRRGKCRTKRLSSSSVRLDLPAPPVPVMPIDGGLALDTRERPADRSRASAAAAGAPSSTEMRSGNVAVIARVQGSKFVRRRLHAARTRANHIFDHADEAHAPPILGRIDLLYAVTLERLDLLWGDRAAAADEHAHVRVAALAQHVHHVAESTHCGRPGRSSPRLRRRPPR